MGLRRGWHPGRKGVKGACGNDPRVALTLFDDEDRCPVIVRGAMATRAVDPKPESSTETNKIADTLQDAAAALERIRAVGRDDLPPLRALLLEHRDALSDLARGWEAADERREEELSALAALTSTVGEAWAAACKRVEALEIKVKAAEGVAERAELNSVVAQEEADVLRAQLADEVRGRRKAEESCKQLSAEIGQAKRAAENARANEKMAADQLSEALETLTELSLARSELEREVAKSRPELEAARSESEAIKSELQVAKAEAEQALSALQVAKEQGEEAIAQRDAELQKARNDLDSVRVSLASAEQQRDTMSSSLDESRARLEALDAERGELAKAVAGAEQIANERIEVIEKQQEEFIVKLAEEYDEKLSDLAKERDETQSAHEGAKEELEQARAGVDQLLGDCDQLTAENVRLKLERDELRDALERARNAVPVVPISLAPSGGAFDAQDASQRGAMELAEARASEYDLEELTDGKASESSEGLAELAAERREGIERLELDLDRARVLVAQLQDQVAQLEDQLALTSAGDAEGESEDGSPSQRGAVRVGVLVSGDPKSSIKRKPKVSAAKRSIKGAAAKQAEQSSKKSKTSSQKRSKSDAPSQGTRVSKPPKQPVEPSQTETPSPSKQASSAPSRPPTDGVARRPTAGSYSLIGGEFAEEDVDAPKKKR